MGGRKTPCGLLTINVEHVNIPAGEEMHIEQTISWTAIAAIIVFSVTQLFAVLSRILEIRRAKRHLAKAICAELKCVICQSGEASSIDGFNQFVDQCSVEVLNAYAVPLYKSDLLNASVEKLPLLPSDLVSEVVEAYGYVTRINGLIEHFKSKEFISAPDFVHRSMKDILKKTNSDLISRSKGLIESLERYHR
jgi:hypothetical protein